MNKSVFTDKHFFFVDDSGSKNWETPYSREFRDFPPPRNYQNLNFWRGNYFVLAGIHISGDTISKINPQLDELKKTFFNTKHVEIKSVWLRNPEKRKKRYFESFEISDRDLKKFIHHWYEILNINSSEIQIQAFILDKRCYKNKRNKFTPLQFLTQVLFDRIEMHPQKQCVVVFDQMLNQIYSEKGSQGEILKVSDREINLGSFHEKYSHMRPRFEKSKNSNFLQMADIIAYNVWRQFVVYGDRGGGKDKGELMMYPYFKRIIPNLYHKNNVISGIGIIKVPDLTKKKWIKNLDF